MTERILQHLQLGPSAPTLLYLQNLITAYCHTVPWESASRIVRKQASQHPADCLLLENAFWLQVFESGTGGTCYESNWAFFKLLQNLGYDGYLTINSVADKSSHHSAIVVTIKGKKYIADVGYPMYAPVGIDEKNATTTQGNSITYKATPIAPSEYLIENMPHPKPYLFHLRDVPIGKAEYLNIAAEDYGENGLFLDRIVIRKLIDGVANRFDSADLPYNIHLLQQGKKQRTFIEIPDTIAALHTHFGINQKLLQQAFTALHLIYQ